jgi:hypothetical protein
MAYQEREAVLEDGRAILADKRDQVIDACRVCRHDEGEAGREESWQAVRRATKTYSPEDREV